MQEKIIEMECYKQPRPLLDTCANNLGIYIGNLTLNSFKKCQTVPGNETFRERCDFQRFVKDTTEYYDALIPSVLHDDVTNYSLQHIASFSKDILLEHFKCKHTTLNELNIAVRSDITKLNFSDWPREIKMGLHKSLLRLRNLRSLLFVPGDLDDLKYVIQGVSSMKYLESFTFYNCNDKILEVVCDNCPLKYLDIRNSKCVTDASLLPLLKLQNLRELKVLGTGFSEESCKNILLDVPSLRYIFCSNLSSVIEQLSKSNSKLSLECLFYLCFCTQDIMNLISVCPSLTKLSVWDSSQSYEVDFSSLGTLKNLSCLSFVSCDFYKGNILSVLKSTGHQVVELELVKIDNVSSKTLNEVGTLCPNLKKLLLGNMDISYDRYYLPSSNKSIFQNLEVLDCTLGLDFDDNVSCLVFFLGTCPNIKTVKYMHADNLGDDDVSKILSLNPLLKLEELIFGTSHLSKESIYVLLGSCRQLRRIGLMGYWNNITREELNELHDHVKKNNLNVHIANGWSDVQIKDILFM